MDGSEQNHRGGGLTCTAKVCWYIIFNDVIVIKYLVRGHRCGELTWFVVKLRLLLPLRDRTSGSNQHQLMVLKVQFDFWSRCSEICVGPVSSCKSASVILGAILLSGSDSGPGSGPGPGSVREADRLM